MAASLPAEWRTHDGIPKPFVEFNEHHSYLRYYFPSSLAKLQKWTIFHPTNNLVPHLKARGTADQIIWYVYQSPQSAAYLFGPSACEPHYIFRPLTPIPSFAATTKYQLQTPHSPPTILQFEPRFLADRHAAARADRARWPSSSPGLGAAGYRYAQLAATVQRTGARLSWTPATGVYRFWHGGKHWRIVCAWEKWTHPTGRVLGGEGFTATLVCDARYVGPGALGRGARGDAGCWGKLDTLRGMAWVVSGCERALVETWLVAVAGILAVESAVREVQMWEGWVKKVRRYVVGPVKDKVVEGAGKVRGGTEVVVRKTAILCGLPVRGDGDSGYEQD